MSLIAHVQKPAGGDRQIGHLVAVEREGEGQVHALKRSDDETWRKERERQRERERERERGGNEVGGAYKST